MTEPTEPARDLIDAALDPQEPAHPTVTAEPGSRLEQLHAAYADAKAAEKAAKAQVGAVTDAIKVELTAAAPEGSTKIDLTGPGGPPLRLGWTESWRLDSKKLKAEAPELYVRYTRKSGTWVLKTLKDDGGDSA